MEAQNYNGNTHAMLLSTESCLTVFVESLYVIDAWYFIADLFKCPSLIFNICHFIHITIYNVIDVSNYQNTAPPSHVSDGVYYKCLQS